MLKPACQPRLNRRMRSKLKKSCALPSSERCPSGNAGRKESSTMATPFARDLMQVTMRTLTRATMRSRLPQSEWQRQLNPSQDPRRRQLLNLLGIPFGAMRVRMSRWPLMSTCHPHPLQHPLPMDKSVLTGKPKVLRGGQLPIVCSFQIAALPISRVEDFCNASARRRNHIPEGPSGVCQRGFVHRVALWNL